MHAVYTCDARSSTPTPGSIEARHRRLLPGSGVWVHGIGEETALSLLAMLTYDNDVRGKNLVSKLVISQGNRVCRQAKFLENEPSDNSANRQTVTRVPSYGNGNGNDEIDFET